MGVVTRCLMQNLVRPSPTVVLGASPSAISFSPLGPPRGSLRLILAKSLGGSLRGRHGPGRPRGLLPRTGWAGGDPGAPPGTLTSTKGGVNPTIIGRRRVFEGR